MTGLHAAPSTLRTNPASVPMLPVARDTRPRHLVHVVDDDDAARESLRFLLESVGLSVQSHASPALFLATGRPVLPSCVVLDVRMPVMSGVEVLEQLRREGDRSPVIMLTAFGDVATTVRSFKGGAIDLVEKPYNGTAMLEKVLGALRDDEARREAEARLEASRRRFARLTPREHEVLRLMVEGASNKQIAATLAISAKTVEIHRANVMDKAGATSLAALVARYLEVQPTAER